MYTYATFVLKFVGGIFVKMHVKNILKDVRETMYSYVTLYGRQRCTNQEVVGKG